MTTIDAVVGGLLAAGVSVVLWIVAGRGAGRYALRLGGVPWWLVAACAAIAALARSHATGTVIAAPTVIGVAGVCLVTDLRYRKIFNEVLSVGAVVVLADAVFFGGLAGLIPVALGAATGFGVAAAAGYASRHGIGGGDVKLMAVIGAALGFRAAAIVFAAAALFALLWYIVPLLRREQRTIAFGAFESVAACGWIVAIGSGVMHA